MSHARISGHFVPVDVAASLDVAAFANWACEHARSAHCSRIYIRFVIVLSASKLAQNMTHGCALVLSNEPCAHLRSLRSRRCRGFAVYSLFVIVLSASKLAQNMTRGCAWLILRAKIAPKESGA